MFVYTKKRFGLKITLSKLHRVFFRASFLALSKNKCCIWQALTQARTGYCARDLPYASLPHSRGSR